MAVPRSTYRLQLTPDFGFAAAAGVVPYLTRLGVSHVYLSPVLQAAPGSMHGYDVVDHTTVSADLGGEAGLRALADTAHRHGMGIVVDVVPNHMAVPVPAWLNAKLWSVLRDGPTSPYARWFDVDWSGPDHALLVPVLGRRIGQVLADGEFTLGELDGEPVLHYYERVFPLRPGTETLPLEELVQSQWYRLAHWRLGDEELNYRRFFDVASLAAVRVELPEVFAATHDLLVQLHGDGVVDGFRIDHPDGLADPRAYLADLSSATGGAWVVVEKILEGDERLPSDWSCAGTTGYDTLNRVLHVLVDPAGDEPLRRFWSALTGEDPDPAVVVEQSKRTVLSRSLRAEVTRLVDLAVAVGGSEIALRDFTRHRLTSALVELLVAFERYRAYVVPGDAPDPAAVDLVEHAVTTATGRRDDLADELRLLADLALGRLGRSAERDEFCVRFQQTCGPVMAKGVEDTAFYRWTPLTALAEVGGWLAPMGRLPEQGENVDGADDAVAALHRWARRQQREVPLGMTSLSTHDTKRSEDVRARLAVLSEVPERWARAVTDWRAATASYRPVEVDPATEHLLWQTIVGTWDDGPLAAARLVPYLDKATREAKTHTGWTDPDESYDAAVRGFAERVLDDADILDRVGELVRDIAPAARAVTLGQKLMALTLPGVPDVYQGCDATSYALVDPDNRRPVGFSRRSEMLAALDAGAVPGSLAAEKLLVTSRALRLRAEHPEWFGRDGSYEPVVTGTSHAIAFRRGGECLVTVTRLAARLAGAGGWGGARLGLPAGRWTSRLTGATYEGSVAWDELFGRLPVDLLVRA